MARNKKPHVPSVLVLDEKHGYTYLDALTEEALHRSALSVLRGRLAAGYWYDNDDDFKRQVQLAIRRKDGKEAWKLLQERRHDEYEGLSLEPLVQRYYGEKDTKEGDDE